jgi:hypothetical protein
MFGPALKWIFKHLLPLTVVNQAEQESTDAFKRKLQDTIVASKRQK